MGHALKRESIGIDDYLAWEQARAERSELVDGTVYAMAGAEDRHVMAAGNVYIALREHLRGSPCRVYMSDMKLRLAHSASVFYPDVMVTCDPRDQADRLVKQHPCLVVEVLSPSTAAFDRGDKFAHYRQVEALREYLLIDLDTRRCDLYRKGTDGLWVLHPAEPGQAVGLESVGLRLSAERVFAEVD